MKRLLYWISYPFRVVAVVLIAIAIALLPETTPEDLSRWD